MAPGVAGVRRPRNSFRLGSLAAQGEANRHDNLSASLSLYSCTDSCTVANQREARPVVMQTLHSGAQVLQAIPERTNEAAAEPLAYVLHFDQNVVHLRQVMVRGEKVSFRGQVQQGILWILNRPSP